MFRYFEMKTRTYASRFLHQSRNCSYVLTHKSHNCSYVYELRIVLNSNVWCWHRINVVFSKFLSHAHMHSTLISRKFVWMLQNCSAYIIRNNLLIIFFAKRKKTRFTFSRAVRCCSCAKLLNVCFLISSISSISSSFYLFFLNILFDFCIVPSS